MKSPAIRKYVRMIFTFLLRFAGSALTLLFNILLVRSIGESETGYFLLAFTTATILSAISRCGTESVVLKMTAAAAIDGEAGNASSCFRKSFSLVAAASTALSVLTAIFAGPLANLVFRQPEFAGALRAISFTTCALSLAILTARALQGRHLINASVYVQNAGTGLYFVIALLLFPPSDARAACYYYTFASLLNLAIGMAGLKIGSRPDKGNVTLARIFQQANPLWIVVVVQALLQLFGQFIASAYSSPVELAQLAISQRLGMVVTIAQTAAVQHAAPIFAEAWKRQDLQTIRSTTRNAGRLACGLAAPILLPMLLTPQLLLMVFSKTVAEGSLLLQISAVGQLINITCGATSFLLMMCDHEKEMRQISVASGIFAVIVGWTLTAWLGVLGAALSTSLAIAFFNILGVRAVYRHLGFHPVMCIFAPRHSENEYGDVGHKNRPADVCDR